MVLCWSNKKCKIHYFISEPRNQEIFKLLAYCLGCCYFTNTHTKPNTWFSELQSQRISTLSIFWGPKIVKTLIFHHFKQWKCLIWTFLKFQDSEFCKILKVRKDENFKVWWFWGPKIHQNWNLAPSNMMKIEKFVIFSPDVSKRVSSGVCVC